MEKKVADLTVQLELSKSRGGGVLEDELSEKFEWLRSQQEQMLVVMTEAIREGKLGGGEAEPAEPVVPKQPPLHADAAATIQAVRVVCRHATRPPLASCNKDAESCVGLCTGAPRPCGTDAAGRGERRGPDGPGAVALAPPAGVLPQPPQRRGGGPSQIPSNRFDTDMSVSIQPGPHDEDSRKLHACDWHRPARRRSRPCGGHGSSVSSSPPARASSVVRISPFQPAAQNQRQHRP